MESRGFSEAGDGSLANSVNEATVRVESIHRSVIVDNYLSNSLDGYFPPAVNTKANYRIHQYSRDNFFARNALVNSGTQFSGGPDLGHFWFNDNRMYHGGVDMFNPVNQNIAAVHAHGNSVWNTGEQDRLLYGSPPSGWTFSNNSVEADIPAAQWRDGLPAAQAPTILPPDSIVEHTTDAPMNDSLYVRYSAVDLHDRESALSVELPLSVTTDPMPPVAFPATPSPTAYSRQNRDHRAPRGRGVVRVITRGALLADTAPVHVFDIRGRAVSAAARKITHANARRHNGAGIYLVVPRR